MRCEPLKANPMKIENHLLVATGEGIELEHHDGKPARGSFNPEIAVIHYGVTHSLDTLLAVQAHTKFYAHVSIDGWEEGDECARRSVCKVTQTVPFNLRAAHAGRSDYRGRSQVNGFGLGIEISNPGPLVVDPSGKGLQTTYGKKWPAVDAVRATHQGGRAPRSWQYWAAYSDEEIDLVCHIVELWKQEYGIVDVVGHDDISPGRKFDPGPAFPIDYVREVVFGANAVAHEPRPALPDQSGGEIEVGYREADNAETMALKEAHDMHVAIDECGEVVDL